MTGRKRIQTPGVDVDPRSGNVVSIAAALENPMDAPMMAREGDQAPFGGRDEDDTFDRPMFPKDCPVQPLGVSTDGRACHYLSALGQLVTLTPREHGKNDINLLFAPKAHEAVRYWPQWSKPVTEGRAPNKIVIAESKIVGFDQAKASTALIDECGERGIFDAQGRVRGRGAHLGTGHALILHTGDKVMVAATRLNGDAKKSTWHDPGLIDGYVYPAGAPVPRPHHDTVDDSAGSKMMALLKTWNWTRPGIDPLLALGFAGQAFVCGALDWRSHLMVTGGKGTGKSTLNGKGGLFDGLLGKGVLRTGNASEAAVRQTLGAQTIPVIFDEFEPNAFNGMKMKAVLELARVASSGSEMHRGGQDHKAHEFVLRSCFQFSAILLPAMEPQDRSRFAILELEPFAAKVKPLDLDAAKLPELGKALMRRMVDGWHRFPETLRLYRAALGEVGHTARACDQFGTLLACADLLLYDHLPEPDLLLDIARMLAPEAMTEIADALDEHESCLNHIRTTTVQARGGEDRETIASWLGAAVTSDALTNVTEAERGEKARRRLHELGLAVVNVTRLPGKDGAADRFGAATHFPGRVAYLAVAGGHRAMADMFAATKWQEGGWTTALGRAPGAVRGVKVKFGKLGLRAVLVPLEYVLESADIPMFKSVFGDATGEVPE